MTRLHKNTYFSRLTTYQLVAYSLAMDMRDQILTCAQRLVQQRGFNGFSYADIAEEVGIRKASLHYYFPTKSNLGLVLIDIYTTQLGGELLRISGSSLRTDAKLSAYVALYRGSLHAGLMCLGGMLASEVMTLHPTILPSIKQFFILNTEWLTEVLAEGKSQELFALSGTNINHANMLLSALQGALMITRATGDHNAFDQTAALLIADLSRKG